jgi:hypothetical protein
MAYIEEGEKAAQKESLMIESHRPEEAIDEGYLSVEYEICGLDSRRGRIKACNDISEVGPCL